MVTIVVRGCSIPLCAHLVDNFDQAVNKTVDLLTKLFDCFWELLDATDCEDDVDLSAGDLQLLEVFVVS